MAKRNWPILGFLRYYSTLLIISIPPVLLLPLPLLVEGKEALAGYLLILMAIYWCTEVLPLGITALMPLFFVPLFEITPAKNVCNSYMENTTIMLMGGLIMAIAVERCNLHRRIAIKVLMTIGGSPRWLVLGFMVPTWLLSMWISNTATTAMMMPIVEEVLNRLENLSDDAELEDVVNSNDTSQVEDLLHTNDNGPSVLTVPRSTNIMMNRDDNVDLKLEIEDIKSEEPLHKATSYKSEKQEDMPDIVIPPRKQKPDKNSKTAHLSRALTISVAFAANAGGTGTLIGTTVNPILKGQADDLWAEHGCGESPINFASWMVIGLPMSVINLFVIWIWLEIFFVGFRAFCGRSTPEQQQDEKIVKQILVKEHAKLGPVTVAEKQTSVLFLILVLLWFFRDPGFMPGWDSLFHGYTSDATPAIFVSVLLFIIPDHYQKYSDKKAEPLVTWRAMKQKFPWDVVLLLGGGFAIADATMNSGLSKWIGHQLTALQVLPGPLLIIILGILVTLITQFTSNVASAALLLPIVAAMAENLGKNPLYLMFPVAIAVQYAFMLPVATPPNAVAFTTGRITVLDMVKAGTFLNVACVLVMTLGTFTWGMAYLDLDTIPWDKCGKASASAWNITEDLGPL